MKGGNSTFGCLIFKVLAGFHLEITAEMLFLTLSVVVRRVAGCSLRASHSAFLQVISQQQIWSWKTTGEKINIEKPQKILGEKNSINKGPVFNSGFIPDCLKSQWIKGLGIRRWWVLGQKQLEDGDILGHYSRSSMGQWERAYKTRCTNTKGPCRQVLDLTSSCSSPPLHPVRGGGTWDQTEA